MITEKGTSFFWPARLSLTVNMNPLLLFSAFVIGTGVRSYLYGPTSSTSTKTEPEASERIEKLSDQKESYYNSPAAATRHNYGNGHPQYSNSERDASIVSFTRNIQGSLADSTSFSTSNGITSSHNVFLVPGRHSVHRNEQGNLVESDENIAMNGHSYHHSPDGMQVSLKWSAEGS